MQTLNKYNYSVSGQAMWVNFDEGEVIAADVAEAKQKAIIELDSAFKQANEAFREYPATSHCNLRYNPSAINIELVKELLPHFTGWTLYNAYTQKEEIENMTGFDLADYNGSGDLDKDVSHVYISNKGFHICRLHNGQYYALAGRSDVIDSSFEAVVKFVEHEMDEPAVADKRFIGAWGNKEYPNNEMRILTEDNIAENNGYDAHDIKKVQALQEGQSVTIGLDHYIMRLPDSFASGMVTVPLNENGTVSLTNENKV